MSDDDGESTRPDGESTPSSPRPARARQPSTLLRGFFRDVDLRRVDWQQRQFEAKAAGGRKRPRPGGGRAARASKSTTRPGGDAAATELPAALFAARPERPPTGKQKKPAHGRVVERGAGAPAPLRCALPELGEWLFGDEAQASARAGLRRARAAVGRGGGRRARLPGLRPPRGARRLHARGLGVRPARDAGASARCAAAGARRGRPRKRSPAAAPGLDAAGFRNRCEVVLVGDDGDAGLRGQYEVRAKAFIAKGESLPYPGVLVGDDASVLDDAAAAPRPLDDVRWATFTYAFRQSEDDDGLSRPQVEIWPTLRLDNPAPFINDFCGPDPGQEKSAKFPTSKAPLSAVFHSPDRAQWYARKKRQNVKYVESVDGDPKTDWGVRILATRDVKPGERLLADYGEHYWAAWRPVVATPARLGYDDELGKVASLVVDGSYGDPALAALRNAAPGSGAVEATWSDGLNYAVAAVTYEAGGDAACTFLDGTTHAVPAGKVLPALSPANWRSLARLPLGAWCRPLGWEPASHWGVVEACREAADGRATYAVRMDDVRRPIDVDDDALEPVVLVRGDPRRGEHWQRAYAASALSPLPRGAAS
ncbi:hypothetical protein JL720_6846 [Aureococcus anophagefferens]|nr:hypothetical protein JL720_6846 [Aureococcus anophagefferens]